MITYIILLITGRNEPGANNQIWPFYRVIVAILAKKHFQLVREGAQKSGGVTLPLFRLPSLTEERKRYRVVYANAVRGKREALTGIYTTLLHSCTHYYTTILHYTSIVFAFAVATTIINATPLNFPWTFLRTRKSIIKSTEIKSNNI